MRSRPVTRISRRTTIAFAAGLNGALRSTKGVGDRNVHMSFKAKPNRHRRKAGRKADFSGAQNHPQEERRIITAAKQKSSV